MGREPFLATVHASGTTLSPSRQEVVGYDLEGRPHHWFVRGETFKRSLASEVVGRRQEAGGRRRWRVGADEAEALFARAQAVAREAEREATGPGQVRVSGDAEALPERLERILHWSPERVAAERERFMAAYRPVSILPPDQYQSVVLQASFGCSWNRCTFCTFYQGRPFAIRPLPDFETHAAAVADLLGRAAAARTSVFLADGNALVLANSKLRPVLGVARAFFPGRPISAFVDVFSGEKKREEQWRELRELGLERVAVGVETGHDPLLRWLNKPGGADEAAELVACLKAAGLRVSLIFMVGVGGRRFAEPHVADSLALLGRLPLEAGDLVYLSPFVQQPTSRYAAIAEAADVRPLGEAELAAQYEELAAGARARSGGAKVALYHLDEFVY